MALAEETRRLLREVSTATLATQMLKRGFRNVFMAGVRPLHAPGPTMVGEATTLRYIPAREDLATIEALSSRSHPQRKTIETIAAGRVLVTDCRGEAAAAGVGAILVARLKARGAEGFVCDGGVRDAAQATAIGLPVYAQGPAAPANVTRHHAADADRPIACGGVAVFPDDVVVGDRDGVVVLPAHLAAEVAAAAFEQERLEEFLFAEVRAGAPLFGTYPPDEATLARYRARGAKAVAEAARLLIEARRKGKPLAALPAACRPATLEAAHAIQDAAAAGLRARIAGWKANAPPGEAVSRGTLFESLVFASPARVPAKLVPAAAVELEIAFRFLADLPPRERPYARAEVAKVLAAFPALEVVASRFADFQTVTLLERIADNINNGAFVAGTAVAGWRKLKLPKLRATLSLGGRTVVDHLGGHPTGDPLGVALALVNHLRKAGGVSKGRLVTTGSLTGLTPVKPGQEVRGRIAGLGEVSLVIAP